MIFNIVIVFIVFFENTDTKYIIRIAIKGIIY